MIAKQKGSKMNNASKLKQKGWKAQSVRFFTNQEEETISPDVITSLISKNIYNYGSYNFIPSLSPKVY